MGSHRYRAFCIGVVVTSISWCIIIVIYSTHLESVAKNDRMEQRAQMRVFGPVVDHPANIPFPDLPGGRPHDESPNQLPEKSQMKRVKVHGHYHLVDEDSQIGSSNIDNELDLSKKPKTADAYADESILNIHPDERQIDDHANLKQYLRKKPKLKAMHPVDGGSNQNHADNNNLDFEVHNRVDIENIPAAKAKTKSVMTKNSKKLSSSSVIKSTALQKYPGGSVMVAENAESYADSVHAKAQVPIPHEAPLDNPAHLGAINSEEDEQKRKYGMDKFAFNVLISDRIGERRKLRDVRHSLCKTQVYDTDLPKASIIICYYNEAPSVLIRMVNSILDHTPRQLIEEVLLIDDMSDPGVTEPNLSEYAEAHWPSDLVKRLRTGQREGLIRAKVFGSHKAQAEVLVFLDSHCEVMPVWLEPLLHRIKRSRSTIVCPIIDIIDPDTFRYDAAPVCMGGFDWNLQFKWDYPPPTYFQSDQDYIKPLAAPTMAGGLFAVDKAYFQEMGEYDTGMDIWGGENLEMSFRIWTCGGQIEVVPCSRIGHIFRRRRPYNDPKGRDTTAKNLVRVARVWLDEYQDKFFTANRHLTELRYGDISARTSLRKQLHCKPFKWYLENIYPKILETPEERNRKDKEQRAKLKHSEHTIRRLTIRLTASETNPNIETQCLGTLKSEANMKRARAILLPCKPADDAKPANPNQVWYLTADNELKLGSSQSCLEASKGVRVIKCNGQGAYQEWKLSNYAASQGIDSAVHEGIDAAGLHLFNPALGQCLHAHLTDDHDNPYFLLMKPCADESNQLWRFVDF